MFKTAMIAIVALLAAVLVATPSPVAAAAAAKADGIRLLAKLAGNTAATGKADYREFKNNLGQTVRRINVEVQHAPPGAIWGVRHNGVKIGQMTINGLGIGKFSRQSITDDPNKQGAVPAMKAGDKITVGPGTVSGILQNN